MHFSGFRTKNKTENTRSGKRKQDNLQFKSDLFDRQNPQVCIHVSLN